MTQYQSMFSKPPLADDNNNNNNNGSGSNSNFQQVTFGQLPTSSFNNNDNNNNQHSQYDPNRQLNYAYPLSGNAAHLQQQQSNVPMQGNNTGCSLFASPATTMHPQQQQQHLHRSNFGNNPIMWSCGQGLSRSLIDQICASGSTPVLILPCETSSNNNSSNGSSQQPSQQSSSSGMTNYCCCCCRIRGLSAAPTQLINNFCACKSDGNGVMMQPELHFKSNTNDNSNGYAATWLQAEKTTNQQQQQQQQQAAAASLSIQLQAIVSQLMGIQGIAATVVCKLLLKNVVEARVQETPEELMDKATRCLHRLSLEQLVEESRRCQEVAGLVRVYLIWASNSPQLIPILTGAQLRINTIKSCLELLINARVVQDQSAGVQQGGQQQQDKQEEPIDEAILNLKSNDELLQLLGQLREKECQERVNLSFNQPYGSQKLLYQRKLDNCQRKIQQIERELNRRRDSNTVISFRVDVFCNNIRERKGPRRGWCRGAPPKQVHDYPGKEPVTRSSEVQRPTLQDQDHRAYDLFVDSGSESNFCVERPKRLLLKPHVGSPETTYDQRRPEENVCVNCNNGDCDNANKNDNDDNNDDNNSDGKSVDRAHG
ncbi:RING finger protein B-like [Trichogramma pretiosum]|uniref:RING finger protein B-like n=1 Tax=Trichogramma pretiosum TaxID=7493 RepID=UPI000C71C089|nr:RING finger protein B-like [Trichogramma pretiosum]